jgi:hypothetical protein
MDPSDETAYEDAVRSDEIVMLRNGTGIIQGQSLDFRHGSLTPSSITGPVSEEEEVRRHLSYICG